MNPELTSYVARARAAGMTDRQIADAITASGWTLERIIAGTAAAVPTAAPADQDIIKVRDLRKTYGDFTAVNGVSFEVKRGEVFGILGPNGAGKTTTLEMIEGLKKITGGSVTVDGKDVATQTKAVKGIIGVQLQSSSFFEELSLTEMLEVFGSLYGNRVDAAQLLADVGLTEKAGSQVKELSGGQKQRFSIAAGLVNQPKVLFLDEPTTGLDPQARRNLWDLVEQIKARGTTVVLTTHYMDEAEVLCDRIAIMDHAEVIALDTVAGLKTLAGAATMEEVFLKLTGHELRD